MGETAEVRGEPPGAGFATFPALCCPISWPPGIPVATLGPNSDFTSPGKLSLAFTAWRQLKKLNMASAWDPAIPLLGIDPREAKTGSPAKFIHECS